jgi:tetratricopeptide (TPR) repeat protein
MGQYTGQYYPQGWSLIYFLLYAEKGKYRRPFESFYSSLVGGKYDGNSIMAFARHFGQEPDELKHKWREFILSLEPKTTDELVAAATTAYTDYIDFASAQNYASKALEQMTGVDEAVVLCNARLHLTLGRWVSEPERKAIHYAKSVEFFEKIFPVLEPGKKVVKPRSVTPSFAGDRLDYARACVGAVEYERAQDLIEEVLSRKEFEFNAEAYSVMAYLAVMAKDPAFRSLELAKENAALADDLGADQEIAYVKAQIALAEGKQQEAIRLLNEAASRDEFGFGGLFYRREMARLTGVTRKVTEESQPAKSGK